LGTVRKNSDDIVYPYLLAKRKPLRENMVYSGQHMIEANCCTRPTGQSSSLLTSTTEQLPTVEIKFDKIIDKMEKLGGDVDAKIDGIQNDIYKNRTSTLWWMISNIATFITGGGLFALAQYLRLLK